MPMPVMGRNERYLVWIMVIFSMTAQMMSSTDVTGCDVTDSRCPGSHPRDARGCCPLLPGEMCQGVKGEPCDVALGISCMNGTCRGPYNLTVVDTKDTYVLLTSVFDQNNITGSDVIILYSTSLMDDNSDWSSHAAPGSRNVTLRHLTPDTWYYARIAMVVNETIVNTSETVVFKTKAKQFCLYDGRHVSVGDIIELDCRESCVCEHSGNFHCVPVCSPDDIINDVIQICDNTLKTDCCRHLQYCLYDNCSYLGEPIPHEFTWTIDCMENCTCYDGEVTCTPLCQEVPASITCEEPVISKTPDGCCNVYECNSTDTCIYKDRLYSQGTWFTEDVCEVCRCQGEAEVTSCLAFDKCLAMSLPSKSAVCPGPVVVHNQCCKQVVCEPQTDPRYVFKTLTITKHTVTSLIVRFQFITSKDEDDVIHATLFYTRHDHNPDVSFWSNITVTFNDVIDNSNSSLEMNPDILYKVHNNYIFAVDNLSEETFYYIRLQLKFKTPPVAPYFTTPTWVARIPGHHNNASLTQSELVELKVQRVTATTALLGWAVPEAIAKAITSFSFRYKTLGDREWRLTEHVIYTERRFTLHCLYERRWYQVELVGFPGHHRLGMQFLYTPKQKELSDERYMVMPTLRSITPIGVTVKWVSLSSSQLSDVLSVSVHWNDRNATENQLKVCLPPTATEYWISGLQTRTVYKVWLGLTLRSGAIVYSIDVYFVTSAEPAESYPSSKHDVILTLAVTCVCVVAIATAAAIVIYLVRYRRRAAHQLHHSGFENKIFQIHSNSQYGLVF